MRRGPLLAAAAGLVIGTAAAAGTEQLPLRAYDIEHGLASNRIHHIYRDRHGFLWIATRQGLSRFDGSQFLNCGPVQGLAAPVITDVRETQDGQLWVATNGGIARLESHPADPRVPFTLYSLGQGPAADRVSAFWEDGQGRLWVGTEGGLFQVERTTPPRARPVPLPPEVREVWTLRGDGADGLWLGTSRGLLHRRADGALTRHPIRPASSGADHVFALATDRARRLWVGHESGPLVFDGHAGVSWSSPLRVRRWRMGTAGVDLSAAPGEAIHLADAPGVAPGEVQTFLLDASGHVWIGSAGGLTEFDGERFRAFAPEHGLREAVVTALAEDAEGNVWIGTGKRGIQRLARNGFLRYGAADGVTETVFDFFEDRPGTVYAVTRSWSILRLPRTPLQAIRPNLDDTVLAPRRPLGSVPVFDSSGQWWAPSRQGLFRFPSVETVDDLARVHPRLYTRRDGLAGDGFHRVYADTRGDVWIATFPTEREALTRWISARREFRRYSEADGLPAYWLPVGFSEDRGGHLWVSFVEGGLARLDGERFHVFGTADGVPAGLIRRLYLDGQGRLWAGTDRGLLAYTDAPAAARPAFQSLAPPELTGADIYSFAEDAEGRLYVGTSRGVLRLDRRTGRTRLFGAADGLAPGDVMAAWRDRSGTLWFGGPDGLSRLAVEAPRPVPAPPAFIGALDVAGAPWPVALLGQREVAGIPLGPGQGRLRIAYFAAGERLRYQYRLEGADREWSPPTAERAVTYAALRPGRYRFDVRAVTEGGLADAAMATVRFTVLPPFWRRPWFVALLGAGLMVLAYAAHRNRVARVLAVERVRTRIATDIHDDIGSSLSRIAILGELVKRDVEGSHSEAGRLAGEIATSARGLLEAAGDIVWSIDPSRDELADLASRVRAFGADLLEADGIAWQVDLPEGAAHVRLDPEQRRHVFLAIKEAVHNVARHAQATRASVSFRLERRALLVEVRDDGRGFTEEVVGASPPRHGGHGLPGLRSRAAALGGRLEIVSRPGEGTLLRLEAPLRRGA
jgi:ligand-binding sensor domain-containing protein/signal transduction histidine kinase